MKYLIIIIFSIFIVSCSDAKGTEKFLESQGYSDIKTYGFDFWAHGKDDWSTTRFIAKGVFVCRQKFLNVMIVIKIILVY
jgi:hypothetical protein